MFSQSNKGKFAQTSSVFPSQNMAKAEEKTSKSNINHPKASENRGKRAAEAVSNADEPVTGQYCPGKGALRTSGAKAQSLPISSNAAKLYHADSNTDLSGSYTGRPAELSEVPVQDVDDL